MDKQQIKKISVKSLVLWTENPRDPITGDVSNQDVVDRALSDENGKWQLKQLAAEMGGHYDLSELPTVVYHGKKPVVYDGNRRVALAKIVKGYVKADMHFKNCPDIPSFLPCNVCEKEIAIDNVYRKHSKSGSWAPLERDIFLFQYKNMGMSDFMVIDDFMNGAIGKEAVLDQGFVKEEIFSNSGLALLGLKVENGSLYSKQSFKQTIAMLEEVFAAIRSKKINTRSNRGDVKSVLSSNIRNALELNIRQSDWIHLASSESRRAEDGEDSGTELSPTNPVGVPKPGVSGPVVALPGPGAPPPVPGGLAIGLTPRVENQVYMIFAKRLSLRPSKVNNLYRDIAKMCKYYDANKKSFSSMFMGIIRMSMRLIVETAQRDLKDKDITRIDDYVKKYFKKSKEVLSQDERTFLSVNNVKENSVVQLLHTGAHNYEASGSEDQTRALALLVEAMIFQSHGKK